MTVDGTSTVRTPSSVARGLKWALSLFTSDGSQGRRTRFYHDVLRLDVVSGAGYTTPAYGMAWDQQLSPKWQYPLTLGGAGFAERDGPGPDDSASRGLPIPRVIATPPRTAPTVLARKAA